MRQFCDGVNKEEPGSELTNAEQHPRPNWTFILLLLNPVMRLASIPKPLLAKTTVQGVFWNPINPRYHAAIIINFWVDWLLWISVECHLRNRRVSSGGY
jgi:hypothetical protein